MTITRSQTGKTPRKSLNPGFVETPGAYRRSTRRSATVETDEEHSSSSPVDSNGAATDSFQSVDAPQKRGRGRPRKSVAPEEENGHATNGHALNGHSTNGTPNVSVKKEKVDDYRHEADPKIDTSGEREFGGAPGVTALMIGFPLLMWYMWAGATYYDGKLPLPEKGQSTQDFLKHLFNLVYTGAFPHAKAWAIYWTFFITEGIFYIFMPGVYTEGKPLPHENNRKLTYYCSALYSWYASMAIAAVLHFTGLFPLYTLLDEFGPLMSVAIFSGYLVSIVAYFSAIYRDAQHRMTGSFLYDFFMGAELNPRLFKWLDFKMFFEVRIPWYILFFISLSAAARQYERYGYVSGEVGFLLMAHFLYANACSKGEELITTSWDMYYEKWGFMLIFWNLAGVPLSYCHCTIYLANRHPSEYAWSKPALAAFYISYLFFYWAWDTCNSQKNMFRQRERGTAVERKTFPQLPWKEVKNPKTIPTTTGDSLLADGWYGIVRKAHYTCDIYFATTWALITGFNSPFPWFYPVFFVCMILHRAHRDILRCRERYGAAWEEYTRQVPYIFIPVGQITLKKLRLS